MMINVVIIDDEPLARKGMKEYVADVDFLQLVGEFDHPLKAADLISKGEVAAACPAGNFYHCLSAICIGWI
jgi:YesN/AraC family two-component response regulator